MHISEQKLSPATQKDVPPTQKQGWCRESHELTDQSQRVTESGIDQRSVVLTRSMRNQ